MPTIIQHFHRQLNFTSVIQLLFSSSYHHYHLAIDVVNSFQPAYNVSFLMKHISMKDIKTREEYFIDCFFSECALIHKLPSYIFLKEVSLTYFNIIIIKYFLLFRDTTQYWLIRLIWFCRFLASISTLIYSID